ncbi:unnamed protein product [Rhizoctonia solani]|uniref:U3 small nucleolar RNA-associated protein 14 n=1 Tax=Rhizoctonia solani TaxID=456999 RepID=A0A8H3CZZ4_9AGAM|nr:unnamed protein product [Rhizoctonia solani]CAE6507580.1 unnamed protein product [Rhizoctonia solani]
MAPRPPRFKKPKSSLKAARANARGYAARQALKSSDALDVYEYSTGKVRRSGVALSLDREEETGLGKDSDDEDGGLDEAKEKLRLRIANVDEDGAVGSDEDEEIDSDAAFEDESDEERFANFKFKSSKGRGSNQKSKASEKSTKVSFAVDVDLNEDDDDDDSPTPKPVAHDSEDESEEEEESEEGEDEEGEPGSTVELSKMLEDGAQSESGSEESGSDSEAPPIASDDEPEADSKLVDFISALDTSSKKRKLEEGSTDKVGKKRAILQDRTEAGPEGEFGTKSGPQPLTLSDLLAPTSSLTQSTKALQSTTKSALSAPLPQRTQDRLDREAAYEQTKQEVQKWAPTMKRIREAEHLAFPLQGPAAGKKGTSNADVIDRFQPSTKMESAISSLLRAANLHTDAAAAEAENTLAAATISEEDLAARRAQLRLTRELMFRADIKAKRVAKIKSKAYRRMKKRDKEKQKEAAVELGLDDGDEEADRMQAEVDRARERATLRHRTTGKWAKAMRNKKEMGEEEVGAVKILQDRAELLRRKIAGGESSDEDDSHGEERDIQELEELGQVESLVQAKGIMGMKFMRDAAARADREVGAMADEARLEMLGLQLDPEIENPLGDEVVGGNLGRRIYKPGQARTSTTYSDISSTLKSSDSTESPMDTRNSLPPVLSESPPPVNVLSISRPDPSPEHSKAPNPWLPVSVAPSGKIARKNNVAQVTKMQKVQAKSEEERARAREDATVEIDMTQALILPDNDKTESDAGSGKKAVKTKTVDAAYVPSDDEASDTDEKAPAAFKQRELVAMAFAGDNVVEDFAAEKQRVIEEDAPKDIDTALAGWGSWGGRGTKKQASRPNLIKKIAGVDASKRTDAGKMHIIISEKKDKKAAKYLVKDLPYPYTSKEQFARSMATPIGTEWNTRVAHQRAVLPRVVKKMGTVIDPLERMF